MKTLLEELWSAVRAWLGLGGRSPVPATPSHGWLLPAPSVIRAQRAGPEWERGRSIEYGKDRR
jgi:hypothetical protein